MGLSTMTGHTPRHTLASHLLKNDQITEDQIRIILGHSNISTTKVYLREKHGDGQSHNIMKRFLETNVMNWYTVKDNLKSVSKSLMNIEESKLECFNHSMTPNFPLKISSFSSSPIGFYNPIQPTQKYICGRICGRII